MDDALIVIPPVITDTEKHILPVPFLLGYMEANGYILGKLCNIQEDNEENLIKEVPERKYKSVDFT
jgi:hypothetical protein